MPNTTLSHLLALPSELRLQIFSHLILLAPATSTPHLTSAIQKGFSSGVGHITLLQDGPTWRSVTIAKPPGFHFQAPGILRVAHSIHNEVMDLLYRDILWVVSIQTLRPIAPPFATIPRTKDPGRRNPSGISASPCSTEKKSSMFLQWINHVLVRQHIRPEEDLVQKARALRSLLACLNEGRKSTQVTLHFDSIHLVNDPEFPRAKKTEYDWELYGRELQGIELGHEPQLRVTHYWLEEEGGERLEQLARGIGGKVNSQDYIYW